LKRLAALALLPLLALACSVPKDAGFPEVRDTVSERAEQPIYWYREREAERAVADEVRRLLAQPLSLRTTIRVALINNRNLQASYEELGIAQADLVQAGMLENPSVGVAVRIPTVGSPAPGIDADAAMSFLSLFSLAARKRVASAAFEATKLEVSNAVLSLVSDVRRAYVSQQAAQQLAELDRAVAEAAEAALESALALHKAGNISDLRLAQEQALYESARIKLAGSVAEATQHREELNLLMGLWGPDVNRWRILATLRAVPRAQLPLSKLESRAIAQRLDLAAARRRSAMLSSALQMAGDFAWLHGFDVGASLEKEPGGDISAGPAVELELPIFDQGQATVARMRSEFRRSQHLVTAMAVEIRSEVRGARNALVNHRRRAEHYRDVVLPLRERIVTLTMQEYNFMLVGVFELLEQKQRETEAFHEYLDAVRDYWIARAELQRAVGGVLPAAGGTDAKTP
jgi:cobalt-zinc-cadmium efflux system outer membrane protein